MARLLPLYALIFLLGILATPAHADLLITGASTILPVVKRAATEFTAQTGIRITLSGGGSARGIEAALTGQADIGMVSRPLRADEARHLVATTIAQDGIALFVNERNQVPGLTRAQVAGIYRGHLNVWRKIDAAALPGDIVRIGATHDHATRVLFDGFFELAGEDYPADTRLMGANVASILYVGIDPQAIGYVSAGSLSHAVRQGAPVRPLALDGVAPTAENIRSGQYPYTRPLNLVTRGEPRGEARRFLAWMRGAAGQRAVGAEDFIPLSLVQPEP